MEMAGRHLFVFDCMQFIVAAVSGEGSFQEAERAQSLVRWSCTWSSTFHLWGTNKALAFQLGYDTFTPG